MQRGKKTPGSAPLCAPSQVAAPWSSQRLETARDVRALLPFDRLHTSICRPHAPLPDEWLLATGWDEKTLRGCIMPLHRDQLYKQAMKTGLARSTAGSGDTALPPLRDVHVMLAAAPESLAASRWWCAIVTRKHQPYSDREAELLQLIVQGWQCRFLSPDEPNLGLLLLGHDDRVLTSSLRVREWELQRPGTVQTLVSTINPIVEQRYPALKDGQTCELALDDDSGSAWLRVRRSRVVDMDAAQQTLIEWRPQEEGELVPVGLVSDDRIAHAIAYLHENFAASPTLPDVAGAVHMSPFHFHRLFSKEVGVSPKQYLLRKQLQFARWSLRATHTPINSIAKAAGFSSHGHFTSTFHKAVGVSPTAYRERYWR